MNTGSRPTEHPEPAPAWRDNVPRRQAFEAANPELKISYDRDEDRWQARGHLATGRSVYVNDRDLGELLDPAGRTMTEAGL